MAASRFVEVSDKEISEIKTNSVLKNTKGLCMYVCVCVYACVCIYV